MTEAITVQGMVLQAFPIGENDRRLVILTRELGRITAFAHGARRPGSTLMAASNTFVLGSFVLRPGRNSYSLVHVDAMDYFTEIAGKQPEVYYGYYFLDFAEFYSQEGVDGTDTLNLLYVTLKTLLDSRIPNELVRRIYEIRLMTINGDFSPENGEMSDSARYTCRFIASVPLEKLFSFNVKENLQREIGRISEKSMDRILDRPLKSRNILKQMLELYQ